MKILRSIKNINDIKSSKQVSLIFGHFEVLHPGHLELFLEAKRKSEILILAIYPDSFFNKKDGIDHKKINERVKNLKKIDSIDFIYIMNTSLNETDFISIVKPNYLFSGENFFLLKKKSIQNIKSICKKYDCKIITHKKFFYNDDFSDLLKTQINNIKFDKKLILKLLDQISKIPPKKILIIGDSIIDRYIYCSPLGVSAESPLVVYNENYYRDFIGGAAIVATNLKKLGMDCTYLSLSGVDEASNFLKDELSKNQIDHNIHQSKFINTILKKRYLSDNQKIFRLSNISSFSYEQNIEDKILKYLSKEIHKFDAIVVCDFSYGMISSNIQKKLNQISKNKKITTFVDLQCSSQTGDVSLYKNFDYIFPTEKEARIAINNHDMNIESVAQKLISKCNPNNLIFKMAERGFILYESNSERYLKRSYYPSINSSPVDVTGAGDCLLSTFVAITLFGFRSELAATVSAIAAGYKISYFGNQAISISELKNYIIQNEFKNT